MYCKPLCICNYALYSQLAQEMRLAGLADLLFLVFEFPAATSSSSISSWVEQQFAVMSKND